MALNEKQPIVVLLGGNILNGGIVDYCKSKGYNVVVVDWSPSAYLKGDLFLCIDVKDYKGIIQALENNGIHKILGAYSSIDLAVKSVNKINRHYGLCSMSDDVLLNALPKSQMTTLWKKNNLLNRYSEVFCTFDEKIVELSSTMQLIIKPNISSSSRGITIIEKGASLDELKKAFEKASAESFDKKVVVEEFLVGQEFTCEMLGDKEGNVSVYAISVKYHTEHTSHNKIAIKLHYNSDAYSEDVYKKIADTAKACYKSLGFKSSFGHLEILMKDDGTLSPIEIGARSSGYIAHPLVSLSSGQDFFGSYLRILNGSVIPCHDYFISSHSSMYFFYDLPSGTEVMNPCNIMDFLPDNVASVYHNREKISKIGYRFLDITNDNERIGYEILYGECSAMKISKICEAETNFITKLTTDNG